MSQRKNLQGMLGIAMLATMFGASSVSAQASKDASGMTPEQQGGRMSSSGASSSSQSSGKAMSRSDQDMMRDIAIANMSEIEAGQLAQTKSKNDEVKNFAQRMVDDHTKAQKQLQQLADARGIKLPTEPDSKHKAELKSFSALSGDAFDKKYVAQGGVTDHQKTHQLLEHVKNSASDPDLRAMAEQMMPTINQHMTMAQDVRASEQASGSSGSKGKSESGTGK